MKEITILGYTSSHFYMILDILYSLKIISKINLFDNQKRLDKLSEKIFQNIFLVEQLTNKTNLVLGFAKPNGKYNFIKEFELKKDNFITLIHPKSCISFFSEINKGVRIEPLVTIANRTIIEDFVNINRNVSVGHDCKIGKYSTINPSVSISGNVTIGERTEIGIGTTIINGIKVGNNSFIGAGSVVTKDIPDNVIAYGNPCKLIRDNI